MIVRCFQDGFASVSLGLGLGEAGFRAGETGALCKTVRSCFGFPVAYACQEKAWLCFGKTPV